MYLNVSKTEYVNKCNTDSDFVIKTINNTLLQMVSDYFSWGLTYPRQKMTLQPEKAKPGLPAMP